MDHNLLNKVYDFVQHIIHLNETGALSPRNQNSSSVKKCPVTRLDISMQLKNSKFLSYTGVQWYYEHDRKTYEKILLPRLTENYLNKDIEIQFREIAHSIRNTDSNPRNNTRRAIRKLLDEEGSLFDNLQLIDKSKLKEAGIEG
jgi:hypothetical protein